MQISRRNAIIGSIAGLSLPKAALAEQIIDINSLSARNLFLRATPQLGRIEKIVVPSYRFGLVMRSGASASGSSGNVTMSTSADLTGVDLARMRRMADRAYEDLIVQLRATGREVLDASIVRNNPAYRNLAITPQPFGKKPFTDVRFAVLAAPNGMDLISTAVENPLTDQGAFSLANARVLGQISFEIGAIILLPTILIDFARFESSGHRVYSNSPNIGVNAGLYFAPLHTALSVYYGRTNIINEGSRASLQVQTNIGGAGSLVQTRDYSNRDEIAWWNSMVNSGNVAPGTIGPSLAYSYSAYRYVPSQNYEAVVQQGAQAINRAFAEACSQKRPR